MNEEHPHSELIGRSVTTIMSAPVYSVPEDVTLSQVLTAMVRTGRRHLAVIDPVGRCHGVIGDRAVAAAWAEAPATMAYRPVRDLLDDRPSLVRADATVGDVARCMYVDGVDAVAVIDRAGRPVGLVTSGDLVALMASAWAVSEQAASEPASPSSASGSPSNVVHPALPEGPPTRGHGPPARRPGTKVPRNAAGSRS